MRFRRGFLFFFAAALATASAPADAADAHRCRDLFFSYLGNSLPLATKQKLFFAAPAALITPPKAETAEAFLTELTATYQRVTPEALHAHNEALPVQDIPETELTSSLRRHPLTAVIVPGIFGEFIDHRAFEDFFQEQGTYDSARQLHHTVARASDGSPLFPIVLLDTPRMSYESMGAIATIGQRFSERLEGYVKEHQPKNIALIGYSRGTPVGLEMLAQAHQAKETPTWLSKVRALVSLGGVTFGSDLADDAGKGGTLTHRQLSLLGALTDALQPTAKRFFQNSWAWHRFAGGMAVANPGPASLFRILRQIKKTDLPTTGKIMREYWQHFGLRHPFRDYSENIENFRELGTALRAGVGELTTATRLEWWRTHEIPTEGIRYYGLGATMAGSASPLRIGNDVAYDPGSADDAILLHSYEDFLRVSGISLNDSQVGLHKVPFWPELIAKLNPKQAPVEARFLGVAGTHHWGLTLPTVTSPSINHFPRKALLKAAMTSVAEDLD